MATSSEVSRSWNETTRHQKGHEKFSFSCKRERVVRGKDWLGWSVCSNRSLQVYLEKLCIPNFNILCFFIRPYEILQLIWIFHHCSKSMKYIWIKLNTVLAIQKCQILCSTQWVQFIISMRYSMSGVFRDDKVHGTFNGKVKSFRYDVDNSSKDQKCLKASCCSKLL